MSLELATLRQAQGKPPTAKQGVTRFLLPVSVTAA
jgi:hypothetical protein